MLKATSSLKKNHNPTQRNRHQLNLASFCTNRISRRIKRCYLGKLRRGVVTHSPLKRAACEISGDGTSFCRWSHMWCLGCSFLFPVPRFLLWPLPVMSGWAITVLITSIQLFLPGRRGLLSHLGPQHVISVLLPVSPFSLKKKRTKMNSFPCIICKLSNCYVIFH